MSKLDFTLENNDDSLLSANQFELSHLTCFAMCINLVCGKLKAKWLAAIRGSMKKDLKKNPSHGNKELLTMHSDTFAGEDFKVCFSDWQLARTHLAQMER